MLVRLDMEIFHIGCSAEQTAKITTAAEDAAKDMNVELSLTAKNAPDPRMRGYCIVLSGKEHVDAVRDWTDDTAVLILSGGPDTSLVKAGFIDVLPDGCGDDRFYAAVFSMVRRAALKRRLDCRENLVRDYYAMSPDMLWTKDLLDRHMDINHFLIDLVGKEREEIEGKHEREVYGLDPDDAGCGESDNIIRSTGEMQFFNESMPGADGQKHHLEVTKAAWKDGQGRIIGTLGFGRDVTDLMNQKAQFIAFLDSLEQAVCIVDGKNRMSQVNRAFLELLGDKECYGRAFDEIRDEMFTPAEGHEGDDYIYTDEDGIETVWHLMTFVLRDYWGDQAGFTYMMTNVTSEREQSRRIRHMALSDALTGLNNRSGLYNHFNELDVDGTASFMFVDVDNFKYLNDVFGHDTGDSFLSDLADAMSEIFSDCILSRYGGDEFFIILPGDIKEDEIKKKAERLMGAVGSFAGYPENALSDVSLSIGILVSERVGENIDDLVKKADDAMYEAKKTGKGRYAVVYGNKGG